VRIKICGLFRADDIDFANEAMPDYIGFVFADSKRKIGYDTARELKKRLDPRIKSVGVFVNADINDIARHFADGVIDMAQLHGEEDEIYAARLKETCGIPIIKAVIGEFRWRGKADYLLFDSGRGSGRTFDWSLIPDELKQNPFFLAGGINPDNIAEAAKLAPYCIDVSGGAETGGVKDKEKIKKLVGFIRRYHGE